MRRDINLPVWKRFLSCSSSQKRWMQVQARGKGMLCQHGQWPLNVQWYYKACTDHVQASEEPGVLTLFSGLVSPHSFQPDGMPQVWPFYSSRGFLCTLKAQALAILKYPANVKTDPKAHCDQPGGERRFWVSHPWGELSFPPRLQNLLVKGDEGPLCFTQWGVINSCGWHAGRKVAIC